MHDIMHSVGHCNKKTRTMREFLTVNYVQKEATKKKKAIINLQPIYTTKNLIQTKVRVVVQSPVM